MGAYTISLSNTFNGFPIPVVRPFVRKRQWLVHKNPFASECDVGYLMRMHNEIDLLSSDSRVLTFSGKVSSSRSNRRRRGFHLGKTSHF